MRKRVVVLFCTVIILVSSLVLAQAGDQELDKVKQAIKTTGAKWQAGETSISQLSPEERRALLGGLPEDGLPEKTWEPISGVQPPGHFDWRDHNAYNWMTSVKDQPCNNCWAYAAVGAFEAMIKIESNRPTIPIDLSERFVTWCGKGDCNPWYLSATLDVLRDLGVPDEGCMTVSNCADTCEDRYFRSAFVSSWGYVTDQPEYMKDAIYNNGPIAVWMMVYTDFFYYSGGVYQHTSGVEEGGHFVVICGWDDTESYWICKNSWGTNWGESGWFRIRMGTNEAGIEEWVYAMQTDLSSVAGRMRVIAPDSGEQCMAEDNIDIEWVSPFFYDNVRIHYSTDSGSGWMSITPSTPNDGDYNWTIPETPSSYCRVRVADAADGFPYDQSNYDFMIYVLGDANGDTYIQIVDIVYLINYVLKGGPEPVPWRAGDAFCDYEVNLQDIVFLVNYVLKSGLKPTCFW